MGKNYKRNYLLLVAATVAILIAGGGYYIKYETERIRTNKYHELSLVAKLKADEISASIKDELGDAALISKDIFLLERLEKFLAKRENNKISLSNYLKRIINEHGYDDVLIVTKDANLLTSVKLKNKKLNEVLTNCIINSVSKRAVVSSDLHWSSDKKFIRYDFIAPIANEKKEIIAAIVLRKDPYSSIFPLIQSWPLTSKSAENLIVRQEGDSVLFLNELRHRKSTALKLRLQITRTEVPAVRAALGKTGLFEGNDYRGIAVLSDIRAIPHTNWFLVTKIDDAEIFADLNYRTILSVILVLLLIFFVVSAFAVFHYYRSRMHYRVMFEKEKEVSAAHEEFRTTLYSIGDGVITTDTDANVKQMNYVAEELTGWKEYEAKGKPIQEIFKIINEDSRKTVENPVERVLREGIVVGLANHTLLVSKNGTETPIADSGAPIKQTDGSIEGVVLVFRDQSEERDAKKSLEEKEFWLSESQRIGNIGSYDLNIQTGVWSSSGVLDEIFGIEEESEKTIFSWNALIHPDHKEEMLDYFINYVVKGKNRFNKEYKIIRVKDGATRWVWGHGELNYDNSGNPIRMFGTIQDVTERKEAELAYMQSEEQFRKIFEAASVGIVQALPDEGRIIRCNDKFCEIIGYERNELINIPFSELTYHEDRKADWENFSKAVRGEIPYHLNEKRFVKKDGSLIWIRVNAAIIKDEAGRPTKTVAIIEDISERKAFETALSNREQNLSVTLQSIGDAVITTDIVGKITNMNYVAEELTGYKCEEAVGVMLTDVFNIVNSNTRAKVENPVERVIREGEIIGLANHTVLISRNGREYQIADSAAPIKERNGDIFGVVLVFRDQTEEYNSQMRLEESEKKLRMIFDSSPDAITVSKLADGKFIDFNNSFSTLSGYTKEEALGKSAVELNIWFDPVERNAFAEKLQKERTVDNMEITFRRKGGTVFVCYTSARIISVDGEVCILAITRDVTEKIQSAKEVEQYRNHLEDMIDERTKELNIANQKLHDEIAKEKELEAKLQENLQRERELNQLKSRFISTTSHEFRTPLTTVLSSAELIQRNIKKITEDKIIDYTERVKNSVAYLTKLLDDVITINKADSGKLRNEAKTINLHSLCSEILETTSLFAGEKHKIVFDYQSLEKNCLLDDKLMRFILSNLLSNAIKYSPKGGTVTFLVQDSGKELIFKIEDEGIGIPEEDKPLLFEPFHRSKNCEDIPGTGLGLSIVQKSVEIQNGKITFQSEVNKGTCFTVTLPNNKLEGI